LSDIEEKENETFTILAILSEIPNQFFHVEVSGTVLNKVYDKGRKGFLFDFETETVFIEEPVLTSKKIIFKFLISKKLHRKYRKVIYNGNHIAVLAQLRNITSANEDGTEVERHYLVVMDAKEISVGNKIGEIEL
jgi:hypothetical protein